MSWYYESHNKPVGPIEESELQHLLSQSVISQKTLVWTKGMPDWAPLESSPFSPLLSPRDTRSEFPSTPPSPDPLHGDFMAARESEDFEGPDESAAPQPVADADGSLAPSWENARGFECAAAFLRSTHEILFQPNSTFSQLARHRSWEKPMAYQLIAALVSAILGFAISHVAPDTFPLRNSVLSDPVFATHAFAIFAIAGLFLVILVPLLTVLLAILLHLSLLITMGANGPFASTFRISSYAFGAASMLLIIPLALAWITAPLANPTVTRSAIQISMTVITGWHCWILLIATAKAHSIGLYSALLALLVFLLFLRMLPLPVPGL